MRVDGGKTPEPSASDAVTANGPNSAHVSDELHFKLVFCPQLGLARKSRWAAGVFGVAPLVTATDGQT